MNTIKNIWWQLLVICSFSVFFACSDDNKIAEEPEICPFKNAVLQQTTAKAGDLVTITGEGFASNLNLYFRNRLYKIQAEDPSIAADGKQITFTVPDLDGDTYKIIIEQEGEWPLDEQLTVEKNYADIVTNRKLLSFTYDNGIQGDKNIHYAFHFNWQGDSLMSVQQADSQHEGQLQDYFIIDYTTPGSLLFKANQPIVDASSEETGWRDYFTIVRENKRVKNVIRDGAAVNEWEYSDQGYLEVARNTSNYANGYIYNNGNLTTWDFNNSMILPTNLVYDNNNSVNVMNIDFGAIYALTMISGSIKTPEFYANIMRLTGKTSTLLPSGVEGKSWNYTQEVFDFRYVQDEQGFVTEVTSVQYTLYIDSDGERIEADATKKFTFTWE